MLENSSILITGGTDVQKLIKKGTKAPEGFIYANDTNRSWSSDTHLQPWIAANAHLFGNT